MSPDAPLPFQRALREAAILGLVSLALGLTYSAVNRKGLFAAGPAAQTAVVAPQLIPLEQARALHDTASVLFIDTRHEFDYQLGHITGAVSIPLKDADVRIPDLAAAKNSNIVVYCDGAECNSSLEVGSKLTIAGFTRVHVFFGGWQAWKAAGLPVEASKR